MSLGVLNNINAIYAQNNLNNTSNSLSKTLQQLSSGSKINSGSDDAAGLSLVNGLQANSQALVQSSTNATEGVGKLSVADGALSQVTNLLNRAVTLATEASNGTLNSSQDTAANQEYQSILSEISNIGSTTTYNQQQVFGSNTAIYTGDSSSAGSSIDQLNIRSLSSSGVGDTNGAMSYSNGQSNVFIDLSTGGTTAANAASTDTLNTVGSTTLNLSYVGKAADGSAQTDTTTITVGTGTNYANTAAGMISAINKSGLGVTASFGTAASAGDASATASTDTGIIITGAVGTGTTPSSTSYSGTLTAASSATAAQNSDSVTGSVTIQDGSGAATTITMAQVAAAVGGAGGTHTLDDLVTYINKGGSATAGTAGANETDAYGVHAADVNGVLSLTSATSSATYVVTDNTNQLNVTSNLTDSTNNSSMAYSANGGYNVGVSNPGSFATTGLTDSTTAQTVNATMQADASSTGSVATISYTDAAGTDLSATDLTSQTNAQATLTALNKAISNVAAQDGYIGAQINTLNSVSSVLNTQSENVVAAQNAVQATDYASATSNMSKYQILSQTGISALAQANSMQQEVTKLLQ